MTDPAAGTDVTDDREYHVLGCDTVRDLTVDRDTHPLRPRLRQRLGGQHVLDLAGADTERQSPERAVGGGVAVAADHRHAGQGATLLGSDDVHDALPRIAHREVDDAELLGVLAQHLDLARGDGVGDRLIDVGGRHVVVFGGHGEIRPAHLSTGEPQPVERLRAGDLVDEVQVDVEQVGFVGCRVHHVALPELLGEGSRGRHESHFLRYDSRRWTV